MDQISLVVECTNEIRVVTDINRSSAEVLTHAIDVSKEELQTAAQLVNKAADSLSTSMLDLSHIEF